MKKIYSRFEYKYMILFQKYKDSLFVPITNLLLYFHISPNLVSMISGLTAITTLLYAIKFNMPIIFIVGVWIHLFLDGVDGALSRRINKYPKISGIAFDLYFDSIGIVAVAIYILYFGMLSMWSGIVFVFMYLSVNLISFIFAKNNKEYVFVIRPRIFIFVSITVDYLLFTSTTSFIILISNFLLSIFVLIGIIKLLRK